ncbi:MAG: fatty acid desaturase [Aureliella sp.]
MIRQDTPRSTFSIGQAKSLVKDLSRPKAWIYWGDFLATILTGHIAFQLLLRSAEITQLSGAALWAARGVLFVVTAVLYMRASMFIHELVHLPKDGFRGFRIAWNVLCGIPFLIPSFMYYPHVDHHRRQHYATEHDGEYLELSHKHPMWIVAFIAAAFVVPVAAWIRFGLLTPLCWAFPSLRGWVERHASSMIIDIFYLRGDYGEQANRVMRIQEVACFLWCMVLILRAPIASGQLVDQFLVQAYCISVALIMINNVRTLGAHRWMGEGGQLTFEQQLLDSVNYPHRPWITELWGPIGTRYHALHHLFPSLPYHNLGTAHRRLTAGLPKDSMYHETVRVSLFGAIGELWRRARGNQKERLASAYEHPRAA